MSAEVWTEALALGGVVALGVTTVLALVITAFQDMRRDRREHAEYEEYMLTLDPEDMPVGRIVDEGELR